MTSDAFGRTVWWFPIPLAVAAVLFAISTMLSWAYYGIKGWAYLVGEGRRQRTAFSVVFCVFVAIGSAIKLDAVLDFSEHDFGLADLHLSVGHQHLKAPLRIASTAT